MQQSSEIVHIGNWSLMLKNGVLYIKTPGVDNEYRPSTRLVLGHILVLAGIIGVLPPDDLAQDPYYKQMINDGIESHIAYLYAARAHAPDKLNNLKYYLIDKITDEVFGPMEVPTNDEYSGQIGF